MTLLFETLRLGLNNLRLHFLRSVLTALGIILGVTAVITMVSIGEGSKRAALEQIERLGARNIILRSINPAQGMQQQSQRRDFRTRARYGLTREDLDVIRNQFPDASSIVPLKDVGSQILREGRFTSQSFGTTPDLQQSANLTVARGRYLNADDIEQQGDVAVLGAEIARQLFPMEDPLNQTMRIDDKVFTVIGLLAPIGLAGGAGSALVGRNLNHDVHIPISTARSRFGDLIIRRTSGNRSAEEVQFREIYFTSPSRERVTTDAAMLRRIVDTRHALQRDVELIVPLELLESARRTALTWQVVLGAIAGISLLVGGIGIMNIMLATVTERTREIGIRRALGATRRHIILQFLAETGMLSAVGGLIGVALGITLSLLLGVGAELLFPTATVSTQLTGWSIILSFSVATLTGLVFGIYPALQASRQDPIVALRHD